MVFKRVIKFLLLALLGCVVGVFAARFPETSSDWAAWIQAVGSVIAIISGFALSARETARMDLERRRSEYAAISRAYASIFEDVRIMSRKTLMVYEACLADMSGNTKKKRELLRKERLLEAALRKVDFAAHAEHNQIVRRKIWQLQTEARDAGKFAHDWRTAPAKRSLARVTQRHKRVQDIRRDIKTQLNDHLLRLWGSGIDSQGSPTRVE